MHNVELFENVLLQSFPPCGEVNLTLVALGKKNRGRQKMVFHTAEKCAIVAIYTSSFHYNC